MTDFMSLDLDNFRGESPTDGQKTEQVNRAYRLVAKRCALYDPRIPMTLVEDVFRMPKRHAGTGSALWSTFFTKRLLRVHYVTISGNPLYTYDRSCYGLWTMQELFESYPSWQGASADTPGIAVDLGTHLLVHAKPSAAAAALTTHYVAGHYIPADMSADGDQPDLPEEIHEAIAFMGAEYAAKAIITEPEMWQRVQAFSAEAFDLIEDIRRENLVAISDFGTMGTEIYPDWVAC